MDRDFDGSPRLFQLSQTKTRCKLFMEPDYAKSGAKRGTKQVKFTPAIEQAYRAQSGSKSVNAKQKWRLPSSHTDECSREIRPRIRRCSIFRDRTHLLEFFCGPFEELSDAKVYQKLGFYRQDIFELTEEIDLDLGRITKFLFKKVSKPLSCIVASRSRSTHNITILRNWDFSKCSMGLDQSE